MNRNVLVVLGAALIAVIAILYFVFVPRNGKDKDKVVVVDGGCTITPPKDAKVNREVALKVAADLSKLTKMPVSGETQLTAKNTAEQTFQLVPESDVACHMILATIACLSKDPRNQATVQTLTAYISDKCGAQSPPKNAYQTRLQGQAAFVNGDQFDLELGTVEAGKEQHVAFDVISRLPRNPKLQITSVEQPLAAKWQDGAPAASATDQTPAVLLLTIPAQDPNTDLRREVRVSAVGTKPWPPMVVGVHVHSLPATQSVHADSGMQHSGRGQDSSIVYSVCANAPTPGDYVHVTNHGWLTGDRRCNEWSTCSAPVDPSGKRVCLQFTLQGHNEGSTPIRDSEGHIEATFRLQPSQPSLRAAGS